MTDLDALKEDLHVLRERGDLAAALTATTAELHRLIKEIERLRAEVSYLRACVPPTRPTDYGHEAWTEAFRAAVAEERAAVVEWLRRVLQPCSGPVRGTLAYAADAIERGQHRREEEK